MEMPPGAHGGLGGGSPSPAGGRTWYKAGMAARCAGCGAEVGRHGLSWCLPLDRSLALLGGLAVLAAFFMPWFAISSPQGTLVMTGQFLNQFLSTTNDLRRFMPGASGGAGEVQALRALVLFFPACGGLAVLLALAGVVQQHARRVLGGLLVVAGLLPLVALVVGLGRLPAQASPELGLGLIGAGGLLVLGGSLLSLVRR